MSAKNGACLFRIFQNSNCNCMFLNNLGVLKQLYNSDYSHEIKVSKNIKKIFSYADKRVIASESLSLFVLFFLGSSLISLISSICINLRNCLVLAMGIVGFRCGDARCCVCT